MEELRGREEREREQRKLEEEILVGVGVKRQQIVGGAKIGVDELDELERKVSLLESKLASEVAGKESDLLKREERERCARERANAIVGEIEKEREQTENQILRADFRRAN